MQVTQPSVLVAYLPQTSPTSLDSAHVPLLRTALALLEVHPDRALGVAVTTEPNLARCFLENDLMGQEIFLFHGFMIGLYDWAFPNQYVWSLGTTQWPFLTRQLTVTSC